tara:strand:- start:183 stop:425 length:243 start_codon:yes stop_codon:yes gene_type:complete
LEAVKQAVAKHVNPDILKQDQGSQFQFICSGYVSYLMYKGGRKKTDYAIQRNKVIDKRLSPLGSTGHWQKKTCKKYNDAA